MKTVIESAERLTTKCDRSSEEGVKQPIQANIVNQSGQFLCAGNVDSLDYAKNTSELSHGTFWPNQWPTLINLEELEDSLILQMANGQKLEISYLEKCLAGGSHYHFRFEA